MASKSLDLNVLLSAVDKVTGPLKGITQVSKKTAKALGEDKKQLKALNTAQKQLDQFKELRRGSEQTASQMKAQQATIKQLSRQIKTASGSTKGLERERKKAIS